MTPMTPVRIHQEQQPLRRSLTNLSTLATAVLLTAAACFLLATT